MSEEHYVSTIDDVAIAVGVDQRTVKTWLKQGAPKKTSNGYDVAAITEWRDLNRRTSEPTVEDPDQYKIRMANARLRELEGKALKVESEAKIKQHEAVQTTEAVVHMDDVQREANLAFREISRVFMRIIEEMPPGYADNIRETIHADLDARIRMALRTASGRLRRLYDLRKSE